MMPLMVQRARRSNETADAGTPAGIGAKAACLMLQHDEVASGACTGHLLPTWEDSCS